MTVIGHSQGAAIISSALSFLSPAERARLNVTTFGGAAYKYPAGTRSLRVVVNVQDLVAWSAGYLGAEKAGMPVPGLERVSFGGGRLLPAATHSVFKYLDLELKHKSKKKTRVTTSGVIDAALGGLNALLRGLAP